SVLSQQAQIPTVKTSHLPANRYIVVLGVWDLPSLLLRKYVRSHPNNVIVIFFFKGLDMEEFRKAMKKIMGDISDEDIDVIFMKVDINCDGAVDWEEYLNYMLREYRGKDDMMKNKLLPEFKPNMKRVPVAHSEEIVKIQFFPNQTRGRKDRPRKVGGRSTPGRFLTVSRDGILHYWSDSFKMLRTLDQTKRRHSLKLWVIDMICLPNINLLAISTTDQDIEFFDISGNKCDRLFTIVDLEGCATAMDYWTDGHRGVFCVGDIKGNILIFTSTDVMMNGLFNVRGYIGKLIGRRLPMLCSPEVTPFLPWLQALHGDWVHQIMYVSQLNLVASCTPTEMSAMALTYLPTHMDGKLQSAMIVLKKGILCFDYSPEMNILVTGGYDPEIRVWNPYVTSSSITQLKGHATAVTNIMINRERTTIVSLSKDKNIRIWDLLDHLCLQSIHSRSVPLGNCPISAIYYHIPNNFLVCATYTIGVFFAAESGEIEIKSHEQPLCSALYNRIFKQVVSGCYSGLISVWDILSGQKFMEFATALEQPVEITAMMFDPPERRLITALKNGTIKFEITCILYMNYKIFVSGWSKRVTWYLDVKEHDKVIESKHWKSYHCDDILCMDGHKSKLLATASCNGDIVLWNVHSGQAFCRFNASESPLVLQPKRVLLETSLVCNLATACIVSFYQEFSVDVNTPMLGPRKAPDFASNSRRNLWAYSRTRVPTKPSLPQRPSSAVQPSTSSVHGRPPGSAHSGSQAMQPQVLFLKTRERAPDTAILLTSCTDGYIYAWAVGNKGGLMGKFHAAHKPGLYSSVCSMCTDEKDLVLFTADSLGYIKIWDIMNYCTQSNSEASLHVPDDESMEENDFCYLIPEYCRIPVYQGWVTTLVPPTCLNSWRGHLKNVVSIRYVDRYRSILTASHDCTVKLWMLTGKHIGTAHLFESQYNTENDCVQVNRMGVCFLSSLWIVAYRIPRQQLLNEPTKGFTSTTYIHTPHSRNASILSDFIPGNVSSS
uniref:WD repeat-containing protein on Y chromosome n=1 Tax=Anolis carolinensis TaxID=28377 RepID=A0A803THS0_ANOCA